MDTYNCKFLITPFKGIEPVSHGGHFVILWNGSHCAKVVMSSISFISEYKNRITFSIGSTELTLKNLTFFDIGVYKCEVDFSDGEHIANSTQLKVYGELLNLINIFNVIHGENDDEGDGSWAQSSRPIINSLARISLFDLLKPVSFSNY